jgi:hypothetical protein
MDAAPTENIEAAFYAQNSASTLSSNAAGSRLLVLRSQVARPAPIGNTKPQIAPEFAPCDASKTREG